MGSAGGIGVASGVYSLGLDVEWEAEESGERLRGYGELVRRSGFEDSRRMSW